MEGTSGVKKTKEGNSLLWGGPPRGCPVRPPGVCCVGSRFGPLGCGGFVPATHTYRTSTSQHLHNPYSNSLSDINPILHSNFSSHVTPDLLGDHFTDGRCGTTSITRGDDTRVPPCPRACLISYHESPSYPLHKKGDEKADHPNHTGLGISLIVTKEIIPIIRE